MEAKLLHFYRANPNSVMPAESVWFIPEGKEKGIPLAEEYITKVVPPLYDLDPQLHKLMAGVLNGPLSGWYLLSQESPVRFLADLGFC